MACFGSTSTFSTRPQLQATILPDFWTGRPRCPRASPETYSCGDEKMKPEVTERKKYLSPPILTQIMRRSIILYLLSAITVPVICFIFGWRSLENIGTGFIYASLCLVIFGIMIFGGNTVPAQLSRLSLPKYKPPSPEHHRDPVNDGSASEDKATRFLITSLISGAFLLVTGLFIKIW